MERKLVAFFAPFATLRPLREMFLLLAAGMLLAQAPAAQQGERDLKFTKEPAALPVKPSGKVEIPRSYALVVGISEYANLPPKGQLKFPYRDAAEVYTALISPEGGQFPPENVHRLLAKQATLANLRRELEEWLPGVSKDDDRVLIYFAGHGFVSGGKAYLAPYDVDPSHVADTSYPMDELGKVIGSKIKAKWKVLLTDSCHSGAITPEADTQQINSSLLQLDRSLFSLTASRDREQSFESEIWGGGHGVFTYFLIKGIQGEADADGDGVVTADELAEYVRTNVRRETKARQNPTSERGSFDPRMVLAYNPSRALSVPTAAPQFGSLAIETNMDGVEVFVDGQSQGVVDKAKPLHLPGLTPGIHTIKAVHMGYEPDGPREEMVYPGQTTTVSVKITTIVRHKKAALDQFDQGMEFYRKGFEKNYRTAVEHFESALSIDPKFSQAALYLARTYNALYEEEKAKAAFRLAIEIDPDYAEAHASYGGMLLDIGDLDEAIRQLNAAVLLAPDNSLTNALLSQAFTRKGAYSEGEKFGREAIRINPGHAEAHFMLAEALRGGKKCGESKREYEAYLRLSDFDSKLAGKLNYYMLGYLAGMGKKKRAAQTDIWRELQFLANFGLCDCERMSKQFDSAIHYCEVALSQDPKDPIAHYDLAVTFAEKFNESKSAGLLSAARAHFETVVQLNPDTAEAEKSRTYIANIDRVLVALGAGTSSP
jgi:uncharacterized caspase-like protein/tetratricopeptide (TPR) repeat protein